MLLEGVDMIGKPLLKIRPYVHCSIPKVMLDYSSARLVYVTNWWLRKPLSNVDIQFIYGLSWWMDLPGFWIRWFTLWVPTWCIRICCHWCHASTCSCVEIVIETAICNISDLHVFYDPYECLTLRKTTLNVYLMLQNMGFLLGINFPWYIIVY